MSPQAPTVFAPINQVLATANNKAAKQQSSKAAKQKATKQKATKQQSTENSKGTSCHRVRLSTSSSLIGELHDDDF
jgi:hypothetical protein